MDSFSPLASARVLVQVLPVGPITSATFDRVVGNLTKAGVLVLGDLIEPADAGRNTFNASVLPSGKLSFYFSTATRLPSTALLYPFETFREPAVILGVADVERLGSRSGSANDPLSNEVVQGLDDFVSQLQENYPSALLHRVIAVSEDSSVSKWTNDIITVSVGQDLQPVLSEIGGLLIPELGGLARSFQALQSYSSPLARDGSSDNGNTTPTTSTAGRRGSLQQAASSQSLADLKASHRMSMPAHLIASDGSSNSRSGTPPHGGRAPPATTFDDITGAASSQAIARMSTPPSNGVARTENSADRGSAAGFGSSALNERSRLKQQGRLACIVGSLYLQAGLWVDALRELSDAITKARASSDYLWQAKAYENAVVCLLLLAWSGVSFRIPDVCYPSTSRPLAARGPQAAPEGVSLPQTLTPEESLEALKALYELLPEMIYMSRDLYARTINVPGEGLPPTAYCEIHIRLARILTAVLSNGTSDLVVEQMMHTTSSIRPPLLRRSKNLTKQAGDLLHLAMPPPPDVADTSVTETLSVLGAVAASYSALGMKRKSALILQDYLDCLTPGLVQARKLGAAEAGMHPAAGIANLHDFQRGTGLTGPHLADILKFFQCFRLLPTSGGADAALLVESPENIDMKLDLLRKCIRVCEALPDFDGILKCTAELLRLAGPGSAPSLRSPHVHIKIAAEEQAVLSSNFYRTSDLMDNLLIPKQGGSYWDRFLVRGVELQPPKQDLEMFVRRTTDYSGTDASQSVTGRASFLYDAFAQKPSAQKAQAVLVAGESRSFSVVLQNLFDIDIYIDSLELITTQDDFRPSRRDLRLSPRRVQIFSVSGTPRTAGKVRVTGCRVTVKGCAAQNFGVFPDPWHPPEVIKIFESASSQADGPKAPPIGFSMEATVLPAQPLLEVRATTLSEGALAIQEGERRTFEIEVCNMSNSASVNFLRITSQDNIKMYLLSALKERDLTPALRYEIERQLYVEPVLVHQNAEPDLRLAPKEVRCLQFEALGKPGLTHISIMLDYADLEDANAKGQIFTRLLAVPITVTTRPSLRLASFQLSPLPQDPMRLLPPRETHCWMTLDFQNISTRALEACVGLSKSTVISEERHSDLVPPGAIGSISCVVPKIYIKKPHAAMPSLDPSKEQQFVVRTSGGVPIDERDERERFWYGIELIDSATAAWRDPTGGASGSISLRDISLTSIEVSTLRLDDLSIFWEGEVRGEMAASSTVRFKLINRGSEALRVELQLYRTIAGFTDRVAGGHVDSQLLSVIKPDVEVAAEFEVTFECQGHHVLVPSVVERDHAEGGLNHPFRTWHGEPKHVVIS